MVTCKVIEVKIKYNNLKLRSTQKDAISGSPFVAICAVTSASSLKSK